jgi:hypothetical protein
LLAPLALTPLLPSRLLPPGFAFVLANGAWLVVLGALAAAVTLFWHGATLPPPRLWPRISDRLEGLAARPAALALALIAFGAALLLVPAYRWYGPPSGDEPKYLRLAYSLYRDLDADVAVNQAGPLNLDGLAGNITHVCQRTGRALIALARGDRPSADRLWGQRNWTVAGWAGGLYYVQSPGLPALLVPALALDPPTEPEGPPPPLAVATLAGLWALALVQTTTLAAEVSGSRLAGLLAAIAVATSAPLLVGGQHFYPEVAAVAAVPWLARWLRPDAPRPGLARTLALGVTAGGLAWLHVKLLPLGLTAAGLLALRLRPRDRALLLVALMLPLTGLLLFQYAVTGLFRPDAIYLRFGSDVYRGPGDFLSVRLVGGLVNALFGPRDGVFVMAPVLLAAVLVLPRLWRRDRTTTLSLGALFASLWLVTALHGGGAPGPPARLLAPVVPLLAVPLAVGLAELRDHLPFRWTVAALLLASLAMSGAMLADWRRTVKPFRGVLSAQTDFSADLPGGGVSGTASLASGGLLVLVGAFWARRLSSVVPRPGTAAAELWRQILAFHAAAWATIFLSSAALHGLRALLAPP